ncbi:type II toxin-antitoxin system RelE/ParE family toxin [Bradyrhizobium viridifuturi]|jgi:toxin ParE1/3/4|nr:MULTISPECIES: type II toxin-antitoxin system RelE/ParE family toxin [Bradyrhizobium]ERF84116.1 MAG: general secretion pathway protein D [Bradyrhizobium sp. DFCI-1]OYU59398.1 MAG: RelE/ParE family toxin [Bradyrhizobium sp. PARBB1]PSO25260.1 type II toxin-antitoxin system RelE/ParE family toxin [Bradyrhizobium sp. MOS004]QRI70502.1 type II toxin-antitoxin system RelE/ParE family toxin [Bradyrhizobium sp. PSBB068]MBR1023290.1 type II toxin-antitoxin system RelE/ParE family toxin [Bradyrhizobiu
MKVVFSRQALTDLDEIATHYSTHASPAIAAAAERRFRDVIDRVCRAPEAAPRISQRSTVRAITVLRYPFRIFYRVRSDTIDILHIRHASRTPFSPADLDPKAR